MNPVTVGFPFHCVRSVHIRRFFWSVFCRIWTEYEKIKKLVFEHFFTQCLSAEHKLSGQNHEGKKDKILILFFV